MNKILNRYRCLILCLLGSIAISCGGGGGGSGGLTNQASADDEEIVTLVVLTILSN